MYQKFDSSNSQVRDLTSNPFKQEPINILFPESFPCRVELPRINNQSRIGIWTIPNNPSYTANSLVTSPFRYLDPIDLTAKLHCFERQLCKLSVKFIGIWSMEFKRHDAHLSTDPSELVIGKEECLYSPCYVYYIKNPMEIVLKFYGIDFNAFDYDWSTHSILAGHSRNRMMLPKGVLELVQLKLPDTIVMLDSDVVF